MLNGLITMVYYGLLWFTIWLFNIAMENDPFIDDFPIKWIFHDYVK